MGVSATRTAVVVLDCEGRVFVRVGVDARVAPSGLEWRRVDVTAFGMSCLLKFKIRVYGRGVYLNWPQVF